MAARSETTTDNPQGGGPAPDDELEGTRLWAARIASRRKEWRHWAFATDDQPEAADPV